MLLHFCFVALVSIFLNTCVVGGNSNYIVNVVLVSYNKKFYFPKIYVLHFIIIH